MKMQKKQFRIGDLAKRLDVERFVIRFWEKEFDLKPQRSGGGQRFYEEGDYNKVQQIKELLYKKGFTINGARQQLSQTKNKNTILGSHKTTLEKHATPIISLDSGLIRQFTKLKQSLLRMRKCL